tara:strand:- start:5997 stop:6215 length:219 start_codon:yes stop_codon:yes gene_type:complete
MEMKDNYKFNKTIFWEEKFLTEEGGGNVNKAVTLNSPGLFDFLQQMEDDNNQIVGIRFNEAKNLEVLVRPRK